MLTKKKWIILFLSCTYSGRQEDVLGISLRFFRSRKERIKQKFGSFLANEKVEKND